MPQTLTMDQAEFQSTVPALADRLVAGGLDRVGMTRDGRVVALLSAPVLERAVAGEQGRFEA